MQALILAGGKSSRMGREKALLPWDGIPLYLRFIPVLRKFTEHIYISSNQNNAGSFSDFSVIVDNEKYGDSGPISGLLSAFDSYPGPWLIVACDHPLVDEKVINFLIQNRNRNKVATVFKNPDNNFPEPLIGIYENAAGELLRTWFDNDNRSLRIFLEKNPTQILTAPEPEKLISMDTPELYEELRKSH